METRVGIVSSRNEHDKKFRKGRKRHVAAALIRQMGHRVNSP